MRIVQRSAVHSYCPPLALPAPKIAGLLPAPHIAGLLPAKVSRPQIEITQPVPRALDEFLATLGPIRSREEMNAELLAILHAPREYQP